MKYLILLFVLGTANVYAQCTDQAALDAIQDYYHDYIDSSRQDEYTDPTFIRSIQKEESDDGISYVFKEKTVVIEEGMRTCSNLYIRFDCHPKVPTKHEYVPCDKF